MSKQSVLEIHIIRTKADSGNSDPGAKTVDVTTLGDQKYDSHNI